MQTIDRETEQAIDEFLGMLAGCRTRQQQRALVWKFAESLVRAKEKSMSEKKEVSRDSK